MSNAICSFCLRPIPTTKEKKEDYYFLGEQEGVCICGRCVEDASMKLNEVLQLMKVKDTKISKESEVTPKTIKEKLDEWIIDQDLAKKRMSVAIYDHYKRIHQDKKADDVIEKSNIILVGSTGSGKTAIIKALSKELNLPLHIEDVNTITSAGYVGKNVEDVLTNLLSKANGNLELAQNGIVLLDEGDKLKRKETGGLDVKGEGVQQALLKITEGGVYDITYKRKDYKFDTSNVLFILAGAFEGIEKIISKRTTSKKISAGFTASMDNKNELDYNSLIMNVKHEDLHQFGMMAELLGRFPIVTPLQELSEEALVKILTEPKNALVKQMKKSFDMDNVELCFDTESLASMAKIAKERKIGARGLRSIMEETLSDPKFDIPGSNIKKIVIRKDLSYEYIEN